MTGEVSAERLLRAAGEACEGQLRSWVDRLGGSAGQVAAYQFGWSGEGPGQGGKFVRAALTLACAGAVGGDRRRAVPAAAAVEVVHNLSLLYDDVLDGDTVRRHREAAWRVFGPSAAARSADRKPCSLGRSRRPPVPVPGTAELRALPPQPAGSTTVTR